MLTTTCRSLRRPAPSLTPLRTRTRMPAGVGPVGRGPAAPTCARAGRRGRPRGSGHRRCRTRCRRCERRTRRSPSSSSVRPAPTKWFQDTVLRDFRRAEWTAVPLALGILLAAFGALLAAVLPAGLAMTAFFAANGLLALTSHRMHVDSSTNSAILVGVRPGRCSSCDRLPARRVLRGWPPLPAGYPLSSKHEPQC